MIRRRYAGTPVGASESIFALQAPALGLRLLTPPGLLRAVSEGSELSARDTTAAEAQITAGRIRVWVVNTQNLTPEVQRLSGLARAAGLPVTAVTETLTPPAASFAQWQTRQLALSPPRFTGRRADERRARRRCRQTSRPTRSPAPGDGGASRRRRPGARVRRARRDGGCCTT